MRARRLVAVVLAVTALGIGATGCGDDDESSAPAPSPTTAAPPAETTTAAPPAGEGDSAAGKTVFTSNCGGCHTLADAGTSGAVGPNLDDLKPDAAAVEAQVRNGGGGMPAFAGQLSDKQITDVAAYVAGAAGS